LQDLFDANQWRSERLRLLQKLQANIDTARWLREQSLRTLRFHIDGEHSRRHGEAKRDEQ